MILPENATMTRKQRDGHTPRKSVPPQAQDTGERSFEDLLYDVGQNKNKDSFIELFHYFTAH